MNQPKLLDEWLLPALKKKSEKRDNRSQLAKLTVVIPSYGRQDFILRQVVYWSKEAARVVIVDGSPQPLSTEIQEVLSSQANIKYLHLFDTFHARIHLATQHIHTPYAVTLGDDEFHLKKGLCRAIDKLEADSTLVACIGQSLSFHPSMDGSTLTYGTGYPHWKYGVTQDNIKERLIFAMTNYNAATCYAVLREPVWSRSYGDLQSCSYPCATELQQAIVTYIHGKLTTVDEVYWLRSNENLAVKIKKEWEPYKLSFVDWWLSPEFQLERDAFVEILANEVASTRQVGYAEANKIILEALDSYLQCVLSRIERPSLKVTAVNGLRSMVSSLLRVLLSEKQILKLKSALNIKNEGNLGRLDGLKRIKNSDSFLMDEDLFAELAEIEELVASFYKVRLNGK